ncbi:ST3 beta-galactoside alpha-2,3-sialyltransferase 3b isoform X4 [Trichomycterus rosablanca]|uniref:ST3 beta-galactoside alpha-2,3-sialyltransferase 3b isoform X4 n=1 Tax=Trichomycterus rosablanca TaxID=2290929 RepID=UPI002F3532FD
MKPTHKLLFVLCSIMVVVFIYYSSLKLHFTFWRHKTQLDLDAASKGRPGDSAQRRRRSRITNSAVEPACAATPPPRSLLSFQKKIVDAILTATKKYDLSPELQSLSCTKCVIVGNGGILANKSLGLRIDAYDIVVRLNKAPVKGYTRDVGTKTTMRITYPEGAFNKTEQYEKNSLFVFSAFKPQDFKWLRQMIYGEKLRSTEGYWKSVPNSLPKKPSELRILNPYFFQESAFKLIGLPLNNGLMGKGNIPTLGTVAITMALHNCDEVDVAGFGYDLSTPQAPLHYYESVKMSAIKESWTHNISKEKEFLRKLVKADVITDLTKGI